MRILYAKYVNNYDSSVNDDFSNCHSDKFNEISVDECDSNGAYEYDNAVDDSNTSKRNKRDNGNANGIVQCNAEGDNEYRETQLLCPFFKTEIEELDV